MTTTIKINGLDVEFSENVPTRSGVYWFKCGSFSPELVEISEHSDRELWAVSINLDDWLSDVGSGLWSTSPLVPAVEVERAWNEGMDCFGNLKPADRPSVAWAHSYAKRVTEGGQ